MPRYYFALDGELPPQQNGEDLSSDEAAEQYAQVIAEELGQNQPRSPRVIVFKRLA
jgi:hypothetical protein